jgi:hypothetical protein
MATESATISTGLLESSLTTNTNFLQPTGFTKPRILCTISATSWRVNQYY